uniref:Uncharacterized protein n=1 Tax=Chenopodium quinoa TaxID=63459 RepID=A0A803LZL6_CHEQI
MEHPITLCIADLGCSSSEQNCLSGLAYGLIEAIDKARRELGHGGPQEYHICLNDLPGNDFNTVFTSVTSFKDRLKQQLGDDYGHCFVNGVPGSFYGLRYIEEEKLNTFNVPIYTPSPSELEYLVAKEGSFALNEVYTFNVISWDPNDDHKIGSSIDKTNREDNMNLQALCMRAVVGSLISSHFGEAIIDEVFRRYNEIVLDLLAEENTVLTNVTLSLTRRERG